MISKETWFAMCLQLHSWNSSFLPSIFPMFSIEKLYLFHLLLLDPPQRCLEQKILTPPPPNLGGGPRILCLKGEASGLKRETHEAVTWPSDYLVVAIYGRFPDISHGFFWNRISHITGDFFCSFPWNMPQTKFHRFGGSLSFHVRKVETPLPVPATERG